MVASFGRIRHSLAHPVMYSSPPKISQRRCNLQMFMDWIRSTKTRQAAKETSLVIFKCVQRFEISKIAKYIQDIAQKRNLFLSISRNLQRRKGVYVMLAIFVRAPQREVRDQVRDDFFSRGLSEP